MATDTWDLITLHWGQKSKKLSKIAYIGLAFDYVFYRCVH